MFRFCSNIVLILLLGSSVYGQDIHFSQFYASPLTLNPALTGVFNGNIRFVGNYRSQWSGVTTNAYKTFAASIDAKLFEKRWGNDFLGIGGGFFSDQAGASQFGTTSGQFSLAYNERLNAYHALAAGAQVGFAQRSVNYSNLRWANQWDGNSYDPNASTSESGKMSSYTFADLSAGLLWYMMPSDQFSLTLGTSLFHINQPDQSFVRGAEERLDMKITLHGATEYAFTDQWSILPRFVYLRQGTAQELNLGTFARYIIDPQADGHPAFLLGAWYRASDAMIGVARFDYHEFKVGFSYDFNVSKLSEASAYRGGPELSLIAVIPVSSNVRKAQIHCPRF